MKIIKIDRNFPEITRKLVENPFWILPRPPKKQGSNTNFGQKFKNPKYSKYLWQENWSKMVFLKIQAN